MNVIKNRLSYIARFKLLLCTLSFSLLITQKSVAAELFVHTVDPSNLSGHMTRLSHDNVNSNKDLLLFVTPRFGTYNPHTVGVWFEEETGQWTIYNEDRTPLPEDAQFNVIAIDPVASKAFTHTATSANTVDYYTFISHPSSDYNADATLLITPNWSESYVPGPLGVWYDGERWSIYRQDKKPLVEGTRFNVLVLNEGPNTLRSTTTLDVTSITHRASEANTRGHITTLERTDPEEIHFITHNWKDTGPYNNDVPGVWHNGTNWTILNQARVKIEEGAMFNCFVFKPSDSKSNAKPEVVDTRIGWMQLHNKGDFEIEFVIKFNLDGKSRMGKTGLLKNGDARVFRIPMRAEDIRLTGNGTVKGISKIVVDKKFSGVPNAAYAVSESLSDPAWSKVKAVGL